MGRIAQRAPVAYQDVAGVRREVGARGLILGPNEIGFEVAAYDRSRELVIDPLVYSTFLGGSEASIEAFDMRQDRAVDVKTDGVGNAWVLGWTLTSDFPTTPGVLDRDLDSDGGDAFVAKFSPSGALLRSTYVHGDTRPIFPDGSLEVDLAGQAHACVVAGPGAPTTPGAFDTEFNGDPQVVSETDAYVMKLNATGTSLVFATYLGGNGRERCAGITLDPAGNVVVVGGHAVPGLPDDPWCRRSVDLTSQGEAVVTGETYGSFPTTANAFDRSHNGGRDIFVAKLNATGSSLTYSTYIGGAADDVGYGIAMESPSRACIAGSSFSANYPTVNAFNASLSGAEDAVVTKLSF